MNTIIDEVSSPITVILKLVPNTSPIAWQHCLSRLAPVLAKANHFSMAWHRPGRTPATFSPLILFAIA